MKSQQKPLKTRSILFITNHSGPDRYIKAGFVNPELYNIEVKNLKPRPHPSMPGFLVRNGKNEYHGYVAVHDLYMVWPKGRGPCARMTARRA
ncbi:hypothetical protein KTQ42_20320 [Noviherbaspirillum sp. L7-7A]|uniref:hypothetical protein n=1 Tax=Noviherbaspirillum sp. L7-7A TaxID=2850560 RepID=UPI001C2BE2DC|nr:hypothetical protein [Noviherbaspirillum sp. L7-7A]MBV0881630.1 hypothetical protein [Noviherbaspirillum sp. L7-7A]